MKLRFGAQQRSTNTLTAFVEALNKILTEQLFTVQDAQELNDPEKVSFTWVKHLYELIDNFKNTETRIDIYIIAFTHLVLTRNRKKIPI